MRWTRCGLLLLLVWTSAAAPLAQEGHPLAGSWHGDWQRPGSSDPLDLTVIMDWDGVSLTGLVNPVTDRAELENASLDSSNWTVHFEVEMSSAFEDEVRCIADGQLDKLGSDRRTLSGTWDCGDVRAQFQLTRDRDY